MFRPLWRPGVAFSSVCNLGLPRLRISTRYEVAMASRLRPGGGRPHTVECRAGRGLWIDAENLWQSKKLDKTSRLVRIHHRIFRSVRSRERVVSSVRV